MKYPALLLSLLLAGTAHAAAPKPPEAPEPPAVFEKLKALAGEWRGSVGTEGKPGGIDYRVTAGGSVVMETLLPGTPQEMISMYFLDRGQLRLTHYCAVGNQPEMMYDRKHSTPGEFVFKFDGGRGFSMRDDAHVHDGTIKISEPHHLEATWNVWNQGKPVDAHHFVLTRAK
jgi:hypothetical protein